MIIKSFEIDKLKQINSSIHLIYGNNEGIKDDIINNFYLKNFEGELLKYDEQDILNKRQEFISSISTRSLFENSRLIIISRVTDKFINLLHDILEKELLEIKIILKSTILEKKSKIRTIFEKEKKNYMYPSL